MLHTRSCTWLYIMRCATVCTTPDDPNHHGPSTLVHRLRRARRCLGTPLLIAFPSLLFARLLLQKIDRDVA